jgi:hypothetical protein
VPKKKSSIRIPTLQHFSALLGGSTLQVEKRIRGLSKLPPVSYTLLRDRLLSCSLSRHSDAGSCLRLAERKQ